MNLLAATGCHVCKGAILRFKLISSRISTDAEFKFAHNRQEGIK